LRWSTTVPWPRSLRDTFRPGKRRSAASADAADLAIDDRVFLVEEGLGV
jgi:hypothetical protein